MAPRRRFHLPAAEPFQQDLTIGGVVVDDENRQVVEQDRRWGCDRIRIEQLALEPHSEGKGAAPARLALHRDRPTHQGHQPRGDRQAQSSTAVLPCSRGVFLLEGPEDRLLLFTGNADAGVAHREAKPDLPVRRGAARGLHPQYYLSFFGELDGIADHVE